MCGSCWQESGSPDEWTFTTGRVVELIRALYDVHPGGGPLHAQLDDWNVDDESLGSGPCYVIRPYGLTPGFPDDYSPEVHAICDELQALLTAMTEAQRMAALAYWEGFLPPR